MKKKFVLAALWFFALFCGSCFSEEYYFKECGISNAVVGNYVINLEKNLIEVELKSLDGNLQNFSDKIKLIEKEKIASEKIKSSKGDDIYYQYYLNSKSKTVTKLEFKKKLGSDISVFNLVLKRVSKCSDIKAGWDTLKIDKAKIKKEQKEILKAQEKIKKEQSSIIECQGKDHENWTNCKGEYKSNTGHKYNGLFIDGEITKGTSLYPGGAKYAGEFKNFRPHGYGTFVWINNDKYFGIWKDGKNHGDGTKVWQDGRKYSGQFKNDKLHGNGTLFYPDGKKYVGGFINGKRHGEGTFTYPDGTAYIGKFIAGVEDGSGECISKDGSTVPCESKIDTQKKDFSGKDTKNISIPSKKWVRISQYDSNTKKAKKVMNKLKVDFEKKATEICSSKGNYDVLEKNIAILEINETPAYGLEAKVLLAISGVVECK